MLFNPQELQAMLALLNRAPMSLAEQMFAKSFFERLVAFCQPPTGGAEAKGRPVSDED